MRHDIRTCWSVCTGHIPASFALRTYQEWFAVTGHHAAVLFPDRAEIDG